jgi:dolichyl-phosphate-mannose-protein mannosyltransferase
MKLNLSLVFSLSIKGQWFSASESLHVYLLGNPIIWWGNLVFLAAFLFCYLFNAVRAQRGIEEAPETRGTFFSF